LQTINYEELSASMMETMPETISENTHQSEIYFQYIQSLSSLKNSNQFQALDSLEMELLNEIAITWKHGKPLLVNEAISLNEIGSRATLHARIKNLRKKGYVDFHTDVDGRKKFIKPTTIAMNYFSSVADLLFSAVEKNRQANTAEMA
jgi:DNA-binding MarR family transcriptional regulator